MKFLNKAFICTNTLSVSVSVIVTVLVLVALASTTLQVFASKPSITLEPDPSGEVREASLAFTTQAEHFYFIQGSESLESQDWDYLPHATYGDGNAFQADIPIDPDQSRFFYRIESASDPASGTPALDFDNDGLSNADELIAGAPYNFYQAESLTDTDSDNLPDYWEVFYFGDLSQSATDDFDQDGIQNAYEWQTRTDPSTDETNLENQGALAIKRFTYDTLGRLTSITGATELTYVYDREGNLETAQ